MSADEVERVRAAYAARDVGNLYAVTRPDQIQGAAARARAWGAVLEAHGGPFTDVAEVGAGEGAVLRWARDAGATRTIGIDVQVDRLVTARTLNPATVGACADGRHLPLPDGRFDAVICSTLFSSILDDGVAASVASEVARITRPGGLVLWFDFRRDNPRNRDVRGVRTDQLTAWFPGWEQRLRSVVLAPPIARRLASRPTVSALLEGLPPLRTHLAGALVAPR